MREFHISVPKIDDASSYDNFVKIGYNPKDNSAYIYPKFFGDTGLHHSLHGSWDDHIRTNNPPFKTSVDRLSLLGDIEIKRRLLVRQMRPYDNGSGDIFVLRVDKMIQEARKSQPASGKRIVVDLSAITRNISALYDSNNIEDSIRQLVQRGIIKNTDLIITSHQNGIGFGTSKSMFNFNPSLTNDFYKLPGVSPLIKPFSQIPLNIRQLFPVSSPFITNLNETCKKFNSEIRLI